MPLKPLTWLVLVPVWAVLAWLPAKAEPVLEKEIIEPAAITEAIELEKRIDAQSALPAPAHTPWFEVREGDVPVVVSAPHATMPFREGKYRFADGAGTAALAVLLHELCGVTCIYTTFESPSDPNFYDDNAYKAALLGLLERHHAVLVLDLHGSHPYRPYDLDFGTMEGRSVLGHDHLVPELAACLRREGLVNLSSNYFAASTNATVTRFASAHGVPAVQLEMNSTWLSPDRGDLEAHRFAQLLEALVRFVNVQKARLAAEGKR